MFSPAQAALKADVSRKTIMNAIKSMDLIAYRNNENHWVIKATDLANWMKKRQQRGDTRPTGSLTWNTTDTTTHVPTQFPLSSPTPEVEFQLQLAQQELRHTQDKLETSDREVSRLRSEVQELKEEVREARKQTSEAWSMFSRLTMYLNKPETVSAPVEEPKAETSVPVPTVPEEPPKLDPLLLTPDLRVDVEEIDNSATANIFVEPAVQQVEELELSRFINILSKIKDGKQ